MVRRAVYDYRGHRIRNSPPQNGEKLELPPISADGSRHGSASSNGKKSAEFEDENSKKLGDEIIGVLYTGCLSRRKMDGAGGLTYLPELHNKPISGSVRTSRSEPYYLDYGRNQRLIYDKNYGMDRNFFRGRNLKEFSTDKVITILERPDKRAGTLPRRECRCVVSEKRFRDLNEFIDEVSKLLNTHDRERFIHSEKYGNIVRSIPELEDGGEYYFGPPYPQSADASTPESIENDIEGEDNKRSGGRFSHNGSNVYWSARKDTARKKKVIIMTNGGNSGTFAFLVDEAKHKTMADLSQDITTSLKFSRQGLAYIERICFRNGRTCTSVSEIFHNPDDTLIAVVGNDPYAVWDDPYGRGTGYRRPGPNGPVRPARRLSTLAPRDRVWAKPYEVSVGGKVHVFDPPCSDYIDATVRRIDGPPLETMQIDWIYGYNGKHCRNNLCLLPSLELVYFVAKVVVLFDPDEDKQRFYTEHTDEIRCIAQHPSSWIMATGQVACADLKGFSHIRIWDAKSLVTLNELRYKGSDMSVECLSFSQDDNGLKLVAIANSTEDWKLQVWDWEENVLLSESKAYHDIELACAFDPLNSDIVISCGKSHVYFWDTSNIEAVKVAGQFYDYEVPDFVTCLGFNENSELITADSNGYLHKWLSDERKTYTLIKTNHTSSIITMEVLQGDHVITGGGSDRMLCLINCDEMEPTISQVEIAESFGGIIAIAPIKNDFVRNDIRTMKFLLGTSMNNVVCGSMDTDFTCLVNGPSNELSALKAHPTENAFITCGMDSYVKLYSSKTRKEIWEVKIDSECSAVDFSPNGKTVAVGCIDGRWMILNCDDGYQQGAYTTESARITCISYSLDGQYLAVGMESGAIYWYHCNEDSKHYRYISSAKIFCDPIISNDWSLGGSHIRFATSQFDYDIWNMKRNSIETNQVVLRDLQFEKDTCALHFYTAGIWNNPDKDVTFPAVDKSHNRALICAGTNKGGLRLYNYPVDPNMVPYSEGDVHSTAVSAVSFLPGDKYLISCGKNDYAVAQWKLVRKDIMRGDVRDTWRHDLYNSDMPWRSLPDLGVESYQEPLPPHVRPPGYPPLRYRPSRRESIFQKEYVAKHPDSST